VDPAEVAFGFDRADPGPGRRLTRIPRRSVEVDLQVSERPDVLEPAGSHQRRGGRLLVVDGGVEHRRRDASQALGGASLHPFEERGAESAFPMVVVHDSPRLDLGLALGRDVRVRDDRAVRVVDYPRVFGRLEPRGRPLVTDEVGVGLRHPGVGDVGGNQHLGHRLDVVERRRPDLVAIGERQHARSLRVAVGRGWPMMGS
jgi:hypothetical protein